MTFNVNRSSGFSGPTGRSGESTRNLMINGNFRIDQRLAGEQITLDDSFPWVADQWYAGIVGSAVVKSKTSDIDADESLSGVFEALEIEVTTGAALVDDQDYSNIGQDVDFREGYTYSLGTSLGYGRADAIASSIGFWIRPTIDCSIYGLIGELASGGNNRRYGKTFELIGSRWNHCKIEDIPGDILGQWDIGGFFNIFLGSSNSVSLPERQWTNGVGNDFGNRGIAPQLVEVTGAGAMITSAKWEIGSTCSPFVQPSWFDQMAEAERYFKSSFGKGQKPVQNVDSLRNCLTVITPIANSKPSVFIPFLTEKQSAPTVTTYNPKAANEKWRNLTQNTDVGVVIDPAGALYEATGVLITTDAPVAAAGDILALHYTLENGF